MSLIDANGVKINYEVFGEGRPIVLVHGFGSSLRQNWVDTGWADTLTSLRRVIAVDLRGHGESGTPDEPSAYAPEAMCGDVMAVADHLHIKRADLLGYSMGGGIALRLLASYPERFDRAVLGGVGERNDERLQALDGMRGRSPVTDGAVGLGSIAQPVLIVNGANDRAVGNPNAVAIRVPNARVVKIPDRDHMTVVADQRFKDAVLAFLA